MKLIIQIPCYNEEETLPATLADLPREVPGFDSVEWLVINDGSADRTAEVAAEHGADHVVSLPVNRGLACAFTTGLRACLERGADVIINTDADNQYDASCIPALAAPILEGRAEMVIGTRPIMDVDHFSAVKKRLQRLGSFVVRAVSHTEVEDAPSGFRALSRSAAQQLHVFNSYTYTLETIIQAGLKGLAVVSVPVNVNEKTRESRLIKSVSSYIRRSATTIVRILITYRPFRFFAACGSVSFLAGFLIGLRFLVYYMLGGGGGMVQSLILASTLMLIGFLLFVVAVLAELIAVNRKLLEDVRWQLHKLEEKVGPGGPVSGDG